MVSFFTNKWCICRKEIYGRKRKLQKLIVKVVHFVMKKKEKKNWDYLLCDVKEENAG